MPFTTTLCQDRAQTMTRYLSCVGALGLACCMAMSAASWARSGRAPHRPDDAGAAGGEADRSAAGKPVLIGTFGEWGAYKTQNGKGKICYVLAKPKERLPARVVRDPSYVLVSTRPSENVRNEISVIMGFPMKDGPIDRGVDVNGSKFDLVAKGTNAWVKNAADESKMLDIMRRGTRLTIKAQSVHGSTATDSYALDGITEALEKVAKECR